MKTDFLHPTNRGGQIRSLEMLKRLHLRHEVHFVAYESETAEGLARSSEYCSRAYPVHRPVPPANSPRFYAQALQNLFSPLPLAVGRYRSAAMRDQVAALIARHPFDAIVCDFLSSAPNIPNIANAVLFQHNVESTIWRRHAEHASGPLRKAYFLLQARRMMRCERKYCRAAKHVAAVSDNDAAQIRDLFETRNVTSIPTGVDLDFFRKPHPPPPPVADLAFVGSMAWLPNIDGIAYFVRDILPIVRRRRPNCSLVIAGRAPVPEVLALAKQDPLIQVTGTVDDVRPFVWGSTVSIVPLRVGGGTRLKIYESMAAGVPVVSTPVGAEGLPIEDGQNIALAATPEAFANRCLDLLEDANARARLSGNALKLVTDRFSWESVTRVFERVLQTACGT
ncbi:MAG: glycosyltransferase family 4 protein [Bryobacteraceae bacterium]